MDQPGRAAEPGVEAGGGQGLRQRAVGGTMASAGVRVGRRTKQGGRFQEDDYFVLLTFPQFLVFSLVLLLAYATGAAALAADCMYLQCRGQSS